MPSYYSSTTEAQRISISPDKLAAFQGLTPPLTKTRYNSFLTLSNSFDPSCRLAAQRSERVGGAVVRWLGSSTGATSSFGCGGAGSGVEGG